MIKIMFFLLIFVFSCGFPREPDYIKLSDKISEPFIPEIECKYGFQLFGKGGGFYHNIDTIILTFISSQRMDIGQVRKIYVETVEELLLRYNSDEKIRPYLNVFPFQPSNISLTFIFSHDPINANEDFVDTIRMINNNVFIHFPRYKDGTEKESIKEPYTETYKKVYGHDRPEQPITYRAPSFRDK